MATNGSTIKWAQRAEVKPQGFSAIVAVLTVMGIGLVFSSAFLFSATRSIESFKHEINSAQSYYTSESGVEDAIYRIRNNKNIASQNVLAVENSYATTTVDTLGDVKTITATGNKNEAVRKVRTTMTISSTEADFFYGVQVGEGGVEMGQNSNINGSIYSNGSIVGASGAAISGDVQVAAGSNPTLDANWTTYNADFPFGNTAGAIITIVDSAGDVGQYSSLVLGSDGFARISYMDNGNKDLKFARCADADCASPVRNAVDTVGEVYEVTSLVLDSNNFAHISYYHDGNDDQKFARCTNADCSASNVTTIESTNNVGDTSAVKIGSDGFARIAYFQDSNGDVKFARCTNADCTAKNIVTVDSSNYVGEWLSLALGSNGFARISYYDETSGNLKFARCTNDDCSSAIITIVDSSTDDVGKYNSLVLDSNNFARISYFNDTSNDLQFAQCTNEDCTNKNIATVDSGGSVGEYTSIALGSDGFARISYYDSSNSALKFVRCTNPDCSTKNISTVDNSASVGKYTSLALGLADGFGRISYFNDSSDDLKFVRCVDADCTGTVERADATQSFRVSADAKIRRASIYIKKVGNPLNIPVMIIRDEGGRPGDSSGDIIASGTLAASSVTSNYGWADVSFTTNPTLSALQTYWIVADASIDNSNYWVWGGDNTDGYTQGTAKYSNDWDAGNWSNFGGDLDFKIWVGGSDASVNSVSIGGGAYAHTISNTTVNGSVEATIFTNSTTNGNVTADNISSCTISGNAAYNIKTSCAIGGTETSPTSIPDPPPLLSMPISQGNIDQWKADAVLGGTIAGDYTVSSNVSLGPKEITGNLVMTSNNKTLTVTGTLYVHGNIDVSNGSTIQCGAAYGSNSCVIINDGWIHTSNNGTFSGSGTAGSYLLMLTTLACNGVPASGCTHHDGAIDVHNQATGVIFYAANGMINLHNGVTITEATAYKLRLDNTAVVTYESGLADARFTSGPSAGWSISGWKEIQ